MNAPEDIAAAAQLACLLEVSAPKPGNVSPNLHFHDTRYEDFLASAVAIGPALAAAGSRPLGVTIRAAVEATTRWSRSNTNLGIVLLLAPLARAAARKGNDLRSKLARVLDETTVADAGRCLRGHPPRAGPAGWATTASEDVTTHPSVTLRRAMELAAERDAVAREYVTDFAMTFEVGVPALRVARADGLPLDRCGGRDVPPAARRPARHPHRAKAGRGRRRIGVAKGTAGTGGGWRAIRIRSRGAVGLRRGAARCHQQPEPRYDRGSHLRRVVRGYY